MLLRILRKCRSVDSFTREERLCSDDDGFLVRSREMFAFFSQRGYPRSSLENDLQTIATISRPDTLRPSEQSDTTVDRVPLVLTYHLFNTKNKRFLLQNVRILSTDQQSRTIFPSTTFCGIQMRPQPKKHACACTPRSL